MVEPRQFNNIAVDTSKGTLTKSSAFNNTLYNELEWYKSIPNKFKYLTPKLLEHEFILGVPHITMEYLDMPTLHELYITNRVSLNQWSKIISTLIKTSNEFRTEYIEVSPPERDSILYSMYVKKTIDRLEELRNDKVFSRFFDKTIIINGVGYPGLNYTIKMLPGLVRDHLFNIDTLSVIHGDYFLANILYSEKGFIRLIDPRGDFGGYTIYGDPRYDIAKLSHSFNGKYDFIVEDKFDVRLTGNFIDYKIKCSNTHERIKELFFSQLNYNIEEIKLIEALLFLSMIPLHSDKPERQLVMLATGIEQLSKFLEELYDKRK